MDSMDLEHGKEQMLMKTLTEACCADGFEKNQSEQEEMAAGM